MTSAVDREHDEDAAPRHDEQQRRSDERREHRRDARDEREPRQHHDEAPAAEQVAHDRRRDDAAGRGARALQHAGDAESSSSVGARAAPTLATTWSAVTESSGMRRPTLSLSGPTISWPSAKPIIVPVRVSWISVAGRLEVLLEHREGRQVEVDRERAECRERAEQDDVERRGGACGIASPGCSTIGAVAGFGAERADGTGRAAMAGRGAGRRGARRVVGRGLRGDGNRGGIEHGVFVSAARSAGVDTG